MPATKTEKNRKKYNYWKVAQTVAIFLGDFLSFKSHPMWRKLSDSVHTDEGWACMGQALDEWKWWIEQFSA